MDRSRYRQNWGRAACWLLLICQAMPVASAWSEAWPRGDGRLFSASKAEYLQSDAYWDTDGKRHDLDDPFRKLSLEQYFDYGLTDKDTITAKFTYDVLDDGSQENSGFEDFELGYRRTLYQRDGWALSTGLKALIPSGYSRTALPQLGYSRFGLEPFMAAGVGWTTHGQSGYAEAVMRYRWYTGYPSDQLRASIIIGQDLNRSLQLLLESELQWGLDNGSANQIDATTTLDSYYRLCKITLYGRVPLTDKVSLLLSGFHSAWGENTGVGRGLAASLWLEF
mgnify:CR=1 FL=1